MTSTAHRVLVVDDEPNLRFVLRELLTMEGCAVDEAEDGARAVEMARLAPYDLYVMDIKMPRMDGITALQTIRREQPDALAVMVTAYGSQEKAIEALKAGAYDFFSKPFDADVLRTVILRALEKQRLTRQIAQLEKRLAEDIEMGGMIGATPSMKGVFSIIERVAEHEITVLISGESGTGKELAARAIHTRSPRADRSFIVVNCASIPENLLESELFGYEKGAFTGAVAAHPGKFEVSDGGTIFLDEIGELPLALQAKLLRVLQEREVERIGSHKPSPVDIRVLAATNRDLRAMVDEKQFREDLFFRLNVVPIHMPPLRIRQDDLPPLVQYLLHTFNARFGKQIQGVTPEAMRRLEEYHWPGNVRELENVLQRAVVMAAGSRLEVEDLSFESHPSAAPSVEKKGPGVTNMPTMDLSDGTMPERIERFVETAEREMIQAALEENHQRRQETADRLGISRKSLHNKMKKYGLMGRP